MIMLLQFVLKLCDFEKKGKFLIPVVLVFVVSIQPGKNLIKLYKYFWKLNNQCTVYHELDK